MNKIVLLIIGIFLFILGGVLGMLYQFNGKTIGITPSSGAFETTIKALGSKVVSPSSINAYGKVTNIQGRSVTFVREGDSATVVVKDNSQIFSFVKPADSASAPIQQKASFKDIKVGDSINVNLKILPDGQLEATTVILGF